MKNHLKLSIIAAGIILSSFAVNAQEASRPEPKDKIEKMSPEQRAEKRSEILKAKLQLSDEQTKKVKASLIQFEKEQQKIGDQMKKNRESLEASLNAVFTPEQQNQFKEMENKRREHMKDRMHDRKDHGPDDDDQK